MQALCHHHHNLFLVEQCTIFGGSFKIVVGKNIPGVAAYDHVNNRLYVNEEITNDIFKKNQFNGYFVAENEIDAIKHEMFHKKHWDFIMTKSGNSDIIKNNIEIELHKYVTEQQNGDYRYIMKNVSKNAWTAFMNNDNLNELIADVLLQEEKGIIKDKTLLRLVRGCVE